MLTASESAAAAVGRLSVQEPGRYCSPVLLLCTAVVVSIYIMWRQREGESKGGFQNVVMMMMMV